MLLRRFIRNLLILLLVASIFAAVGYYIYQGDRKQRIDTYNINLTHAVSTAIQDALFNATRTMEADQPHYILLTVGTQDSLSTIAQKYATTADVIRFERVIGTVWRSC